MHLIQCPQVAERADAGRLARVEREPAIRCQPARVQAAHHRLGAYGRLVGPPAGIEVVCARVREPDAVLGEAVADPEAPVLADGRTRAVTRDGLRPVVREARPVVCCGIVGPQVVEEGRRARLAGPHDKADAVHPDRLMPEPGVGTRASRVALPPCVGREVERPDVVVRRRAVSATEQVRNSGRGIEGPGVILARAWSSGRVKFAPGDRNGRLRRGLRDGARGVARVSEEWQRRLLPAPELSATWT